jgi:HPt (histidine-containing phosphotransfer) domain-containing protein
MRREVEAVIGDAQTYAELIQVFLLEGEERLSDIERAIFEREETTALRVCHSLKGSCASIGVVRLVEMLAVLETDCGIGKWEYSIVSRLRTEWDAVRALLRPYAVPAHVD